MIWLQNNNLALEGLGGFESMTYFYLLGLLIVSISCIHDPDQVKEIDTTLINAGNVGKQEIGVDKNNRMLVQTQKELDEELRSAVWFNSQILFEVKYLLSRLRSCFARKRDSISPGAFDKIDLSVIKQIQNKRDSEEVGLNSNGQYRLISKEGYTKRLDFERGTMKKLVLLKEEVKNQLVRCDYL